MGNGCGFRPAPICRLAREPKSLALETRHLAHPLNCSLLFSCFAMDAKKKLNDTWSKGLIFTPVWITGTLGRGPEESRLLNWMSLQA